MRLVLLLFLALPFSTLALAQGYFHGYPCTDDCSGHEAGYNWAEKKSIENPDDCDGNSNSFIEGCKAYAIEQQETEPSDQQGDNGLEEGLDAGPDGLNDDDSDQEGDADDSE